MVSVGQEYAYSLSERPWLKAFQEAVVSVSARAAVSSEGLIEDSLQVHMHGC